MASDRPRFQSGESLAKGIFGARLVLVAVKSLHRTTNTPTFLGKTCSCNPFNVNLQSRQTASCWLLAIPVAIGFSHGRKLFEMKPGHWTSWQDALQSLREKSRPNVSNYNAAMNACMKAFQWRSALDSWLFFR